jgi:hypothetical protein
MHLTGILLLFIAAISIISSIVFDSLIQSFQPISIFIYSFSIIIYFLIILDQECVINGESCIVWGWIKFIISFILLSYFIYLKIYNGIALLKEKKDDA